MALFRSRRRRSNGKRSSGKGKTQHEAPTRSRVIRDIVGPTGWVFSDAWQQLDDHGDAYRKSFDRRLPPSLFVSDRDRLRASQPMPLAERCIEDWTPSNPASPTQPEVDSSPEPTT